MLGACNTCVSLQSRVTSSGATVDGLIFFVIFLFFFVCLFVCEFVCLFVSFVLFFGFVCLFCMFVCYCLFFCLFLFVLFVCLIFFVVVFFVCFEDVKMKPAGLGKLNEWVLELNFAGQIIN